MNLHEHSDIGTHWIAFYALNNNVTYFGSFRVEPIPKKIKKFNGNKNTMGSKITKNIFRIQPYDSVMCGYFCIGIIYFMLKGKSLTDFSKLFPPSDFKNNYDIIFNYFKNG